jgi:HAE1 family hydrophobic/amphiphilic exporter-1
MSLKDAAIEGAKVRFRPILMTSFAFIAGLIPLVRASGAGAIGNRTIGSSAMGGMLLGTLIGVLVIPGLYYAFAKLSGGKKLIEIENEDETPLSEDFIEKDISKSNLMERLKKLFNKKNKANEANNV